MKIQNTTSNYSIGKIDGKRGRSSEYQGCRILVNGLERHWLNCCGNHSAEKYGA